MKITLELAFIICQIIAVKCSYAEDEDGVHTFLLYSIIFLILLGR